MSSKSHLPPRCPPQGKTVTRSVHCPVSTSSSEDTALCYRHLKCVPGSSTLKQQPGIDSDTSQGGNFSQQSGIELVVVSDGAVSSKDLSSIGNVTGLESTCSYGPNSPKSKEAVAVSPSSSEDTGAFYNLLHNLSTDSDSSQGGRCSQQSAMDSVAVSDGVVTSQTLSSVNDQASSDCIGSVTGLESTCTYGPNSPKSKDKVSIPETSVMSALSEYLSLNPVRSSEDSFLISGMVQRDLVQGTSASVRDASSETLRRRQNRERSRSHMVQYIAELERTVDDLQKFESELALRVSSLLQQRAVLSIENSNLKQQMARVEQDKLIAEGEYQSLKQEEHWLKFMSDSPSEEGRCTTRDIWASSYDNKDISLEKEDIWKLPDLRKLDLR